MHNTNEAIHLFESLKRKVPHDAQHPDEFLRRLVSLFTANRFPEKKLIVTAGERWSTIYFILDGMIRLYYSDVQGREFNSSFHVKGDWLIPMEPTASTRRQYRQYRHH